MDYKSESKVITDIIPGLGKKKKKRKKTEPSLWDPRGEVCWPHHKLEGYSEGVELMDLTSCCLGVKPGAHHPWWGLGGSVRCLRYKTP